MESSAKRRVTPEKILKPTAAATNQTHGTTQAPEEKRTDAHRRHAWIRASDRIAGIQVNSQAMSLAVERPPRPISPAPQALEQGHQDNSGGKTREGRNLRWDGGRGGKGSH